MAQSVSACSITDLIKQLDDRHASQRSIRETSVRLRPQEACCTASLMECLRFACCGILYTVTHIEAYYVDHNDGPP